MFLPGCRLSSLNSSISSSTQFLYKLQVFASQKKMKTHHIDSYRTVHTFIQLIARLEFHMAFISCTVVQANERKLNLQHKGAPPIKPKKMPQNDAKASMPKKPEMPKNKDGKDMEQAEAVQQAGAAAKPLTCTVYLYHLVACIIILQQCN